MSFFALEFLSKCRICKPVRHSLKSFDGRCFNGRFDMIVGKEGTLFQRVVRREPSSPIEVRVWMMIPEYRVT